jgi:hypothetical protein
MNTPRGAAPLITLAAALLTGRTMLSQSRAPLEPYVAQNKLYALQKPAGWKVVEAAQSDSLRITINSPDGSSAVDFSWTRNPQGRSNAVRYLASYRQLLSRAWPDVAFTESRASQDDRRAVTVVTFHAGKTSIRGKYYFESNSNTLSAQGFFAPEGLLPSQRVLLLNVMASMAFIKNDRRPDPAAGEPQYYRPQMSTQSAGDRSLSVKIPADWAFMAGGGKVVAGGRGGAPGFIFTSFEGNPMLRGASIAQGIIGTPYLRPPQALVHVLQGFQHRNVRIQSAQPDIASARELAARIRRQGDAQDIVATWTSSAGTPCVGAFKLVNALPSATGLWFTIVAGIWAPEKDTYLYMPALEDVAASFAINDEFARQYIQAGLRRLRELQAQTEIAMRDLNRAREQNQRDWEDRQRRKEFADSKWDDYRRGQSYWVSDLEGGKVYATDSWGTRDTVTGDYYEGRPYNWTNFEGENPRYNESMRQISSYELKQMGGL